MSHDQRDQGHIPQKFEVIFVVFWLMKNIIFIKTKSFVGRNTSDHACQIFCSKSNRETMYHWFFFLEITVANIMKNLNVCSAHSYLYPRSRFNSIKINTLKTTNCHAVFNSLDNDHNICFRSKHNEYSKSNWIEKTTPPLHHILCNACIGFVGIRFEIRYLLSINLPSKHNCILIRHLTLNITWSIRFNFSVWFVNWFTRHLSHPFV